MAVPAISPRPSFWSELFTARGRTNRGRAWLTLLLLWGVAFVVVMPLAMVAHAFGPEAPNDPVRLVLAIVIGVVSAALVVLFLVVGILVAVRRLHDRDKSGHWLWLLY